MNEKSAAFLKLSVLLHLRLVPIMIVLHTVVLLFRKKRQVSQGIDLQLPVLCQDSIENNRCCMIKQLALHDKTVGVM